MADDGPVQNETTIDSSSPTRPFWNFQPTNVREIIQRQISTTVDKRLDAYAQLSIGNWDGRYLNGMPVQAIKAGDNDGNYYHIVGMSIVGDASVAAP
jgi:hypothetical protein